jgi:hypothetical protein
VGIFGKKKGINAAHGFLAFEFHRLLPDFHLRNIQKGPCAFFSASFRYGGLFKEYFHPEEVRFINCSFKTENKNDRLEYTFHIGETGSATLKVNSTNRQQISYYGDLVEIERGR